MKIENVEIRRKIVELIRTLTAAQVISGGGGQHETNQVVLRNYSLCKIERGLAP